MQVPVFLRKGQAIRTHWWRRHDATKVWYEWSVSEPFPLPIQNPGGRSWSIGLRMFTWNMWGPFAQQSPDHTSRHSSFCVRWLVIVCALSSSAFSRRRRFVK